MRSKQSQAGFSLIELLISLVVTAIAVLAAVALMTKFARSAGASAEVSIMEEARGSSETLLRADFDGAGYNLTRPTPPLAGTISQPFLTSTDFNTSVPGTITKTSPTSWSNAAGIYGIGMGLGSFTATLPGNGAYLSLWNSAGEGRTIIAGFGSWMGIYEGSDEVATTYGTPVIIPPHWPGDTYTISIENDFQGRGMSRVLKYYRTRNGVKSLLYTSAKPVPASPIGVSNGLIYQGDSITNAKITGAPLVNLFNNDTDIPPLPIDGGTQLTGPITITGTTSVNEEGNQWVGSSVVVLSGDPTIDAISTITEWNKDSTSVDVRVPKRGSFNTGDNILFIDYGSTDPAAPSAPTTALCRVTSVATNAEIATLTLVRVRSDNPAWSRLWSTDADHLHTFRAGTTTLVTLKPPVTYSISDDSSAVGSGANRLVRVEGDRASTIAFNARKLNINAVINPPYRAYTVTVTLAAEGVETNSTAEEETRGTIEFTSTPRALNLASNQLN